jgi:heat shock protein HslJ
MPDLDERLRRDLPRIAPERLPDGETFYRVVQRRSDRRRLLRIGGVALSITVVLGSAGVFALLRHTFGEHVPAASPSPGLTTPGNVDGVWHIVGFHERGSRELTATSDITLEISVENQQYQGDLICNRYGGSLSRNGGRLAFGEPSVTAASCAPDKTHVDAYLYALSRVDSYTMNGNRLWLLGRSGHILITAQPRPRPAEGREIGLGIPLCDIHSLKGVDMLGDGTEGTAWTGVYITEGGTCPTGPSPEYVVAVDVDGDGRADGSSYLSACEGCEPYATTNFDADGADELVVLTQQGSTPTYAVYFWLGGPSPRSPGLYQATVGPTGAPAAGFPANEFFSLTAGGDEGFSSAIDCESFPVDPVLVVVYGNGSVDGTTEEVYVTRLRYGGADEDKRFSILDVQYFSQPAGDPLPVAAPDMACGVDWTPF